MQAHDCGWILGRRLQWTVTTVGGMKDYPLNTLLCCTCFGQVLFPGLRSTLSALVLVLAYHFPKHAQVDIWLASLPEIIELGSDGSLWVCASISAGLMYRIST